MNLDSIEGLTFEEIDELYDNIATCWCNTRPRYSSSRCYWQGNTSSVVCSIGTHYSKSNCTYQCSSYCNSILYVNYQDMSQEYNPRYCYT